MKPKKRKRGRPAGDPVVSGLELEAKRLERLAGELKDLRAKELWSPYLEKEYQAVLKDLAVNVGKRRAGSTPISAVRGRGRPRKAA